MLVSFTPQISVYSSGHWSTCQAPTPARAARGSASESSVLGLRNWFVSFPFFSCLKLQIGGAQEESELPSVSRRIWFLKPPARLRPHGHQWTWESPRRLEVSPGGGCRRWPRQRRHTWPPSRHTPHALLPMQCF